jgi:hypothetical protein
MSIDALFISRKDKEKSTIEQEGFYRAFAG